MREGLAAGVGERVKSLHAGEKGRGELAGLEKAVDLGGAGIGGEALRGAVREEAWGERTEGTERNAARASSSKARSTRARPSASTLPPPRWCRRPSERAGHFRALRLLGMAGGIFGAGGGGRV